MRRTPQQRHDNVLKFMRKIEHEPQSYTGSERDMDRAKQWCRRNGLAYFKAGYWHVSDQGLRFLRANA